MRLCVIGAGYVGLVTAACFAEMGNQVRCVERDRERVARLRRGEMPIYEPGLESILRDQLDAARLTFTASPAISFMKEILVARKALAAYLLNSASRRPISRTRS